MWYVVACEHGSSQWRTWALDRIDTVEPLATTFETPPPPYDPVDFVTQSLARGRRHHLRLLAHAPAEVARAIVPATIAEIIERDDGCELRLATDDMTGAAGWVASLRLDVDVLEPAELREELVALARRLEERYG